MGATTPARVGTVAAAIAVVALALLLPGLGQHGLWSDAELPVLDRSLAALGEAKSGLVRSTFVPDLLRTWGVDAFGNELGLRLPHALATAGLVAAAAALARLRGRSMGLAALAGIVVLAMPAIGLAGRSALGNPIGELFAVLTVLAAAAIGPELRSRTTVALAMLGALAWVLAIASSGIVLGGCVPLVGALLVLGPHPRAPMVRAALLGMTVASGIVAIVLVMGQGDGWIPLLGAAKDLELVDKPELRRFTAALADLGHQSFPWLPIAIVGAAIGRDRAVASWLVVGIVVATAWSLVYGRIDLPLRVPVALCAVEAVATIADPERPLALRRGAAFVAVLGVLVLGKDVELSPAEVAAPLHTFGVYDYPADDLATVQRWTRVVKLVALALLLGLLAAPLPDGGRRERLIGLVPRRLRVAAMPAFVGGVALLAAWLQTRVLVPATSEKLSPKTVLARHAELVEAGALGPELAVHRIRDKALGLYGPTTLESLASRRDISAYLTADEPRAALIRSLDLAAVHQHHRQAGTPLFVLDASHDHLRLVANVLPEGTLDQNPIPRVLFDEPLELEHTTLVRFEEYVEIVGWQVDEPIVRGRKHTLQLALRVLRPLPGGSKIYSRFIGGRLSRINGEPMPIGDDVYPCNLWRAGDYVLHRLEFDAPTLEILPGTYDFMVGLRRSEQKNYTISIPEGEDGEYGVHVDDPKRSFAKIGTVEVWQNQGVHGTLGLALAARLAGPPVLPEPSTEPPVAIVLEWTAPDTCPAPDDVRGAIAALLARRVDLDPTASVVVRGDIERTGAGFLLRLSVDTADGAETRELENERCDVLGEAAALIVATGIDPARVAARVHEQEIAAKQAPPQAPTITTQRDTSEQPSAAVERPAGTAPPKRARPRPRGAISIAAGPAIGLVPSVAGWLGGDVALHLGRARVGATVGHAFARESADNDDDAGARVQLTSAGLLGCFVPSWRKVALAACGLAELGAMRATGTGAGVDPTKQQALWVGLGLRSGVEWSPIPWLALVAQVDVLAAARRPGFHVVRAGDTQRVFRAAPAALRVSGGLSFRFP